MPTQLATRFQLWLYSVLLFCSVTLTSCSAIKTIFKAGFFSAIILIVAVVGLVFWAMSKRGGGNSTSA